MTHTIKHVLNLQLKIKKRWVKPFLECLDITKTSSGDIESDTEGSWWIFTWGS